MKNLQNIRFHDASVESIKFLFNTSIEIVIEVFDESSESFKTIQIVFNDVKQMKFSGFSLNENSDVEIFSFDFKERKEFFDCKLTLLTGFEKMSTTFHFSYKNSVATHLA